MIIYLDQNKWIELARIENGLDISRRAMKLRNELEAAAQSGCVFPLSAIHLIEFSRIRDNSRRHRLGKIMWKLSQGFTTAPLKKILCWELEVAFSKVGYPVVPCEFDYLGRGIAHAFGEKLESPVAAAFSDELDEAMLSGTSDLPPIQ